MIKRFAFTLLTLLIAANLWGQSLTLLTTDSPNSETNPYLISSVADWNTFAADVNAGYSYSGKFVKLTSNIGTAEIPVTTMVGDLVDAVYYSFKGTFDGDNKTLTFHYNYTELQSSQRLNRVAPFRYINGATIKNLRVAGDINMDKPYAGGLFCVNDIYEDSKSNIIDCIVSVNITGYKDNCGGFAATALNTTFTRCVYNGRLNIGRNSGGFSSQGNKKTIIENCLCAPAEDSEIWSRSGNFVYNKNVVITNSYYTLLPNETQSLLTQGTRAYTSVPPAEPAVFTHYRRLIDGNNYYVEGNATIINLPDGYDYTGSEIPVTYGMTFEGTALTETTDFIASFTPSPVKEIGEYTLTLSGNNSNNYCGSISQTFTVIDGHLEGGGTAEDPYLIEDAHDWTVLTNRVDYGTGCDSYYKLAADLIINDPSSYNTIIGTTEHPFTGHFDGGWHTLTININRTGLIYAAPFGVVDGATIENLKVAGTIRTDNKFAGGILGWVNNTDDTRETHINNCISVVNIESSTNGDGSHGGFAGQVEKGMLRFENCAFEGSIKGALTERCAGFVSWRQGSVEYNNCTMAGTILIADNPSGLTDNTANFHRNGGGSFTNAYYITPSVQQYVQGLPISSSATAPTDGIYRKYTVSANNYYVPSVTISELDNSTTTTFSYTGSVIPVDPVITYYGWTLTKNTDYTVSLTYSETEEGDYTAAENIQAAGYYKMTFTGINNYGGSKVYTIHVININSWSVLKETLAAESGTITIHTDLSDDSNVGALVVSHTTVLDLNGHTLDRNRTAEEADGCVIKVENGASLTIINGTIKGGWNNESGGGIYSKGNLTLNGADVVNNKCRELGGGIYCHGGTFYMTGGGVIRNETTHDNLTTAGGGGIHADGVTAFEMNNVIVTENKTVSKGGGIRFHIGAIKAYINNCTITKNESKTNAQSKGGGIYFETTDQGRLDVTGGLICVNSVSAEGGGVYVIRGVVSIKDCQILGNVSGGIGGAVSAYGGNHSKIILDGCGINGNSSINEGGGVYVGDDATIEIQGEMRIIGNESKDTESNNLYLAKSDGVITVVGSLPGAVIGVSRSGAGTLTSGLAGYGTIGNFISECGTRVVLPVGGEAYLQNYYIWGVTEGWPDLAGVTKDGDNYTFNAIVVIPNGRTESPSKIVLEGAGGIVVADGGQLVYTNTDHPISAKVQKSIKAADSKDDVYGWYTIASPVNEPNITGATNLITMNGENPTYDLLMYDEPHHYWRNYRSETTSTYFDGKLTNGRGYLYRNANDVTAEFNGLINSGNVTCSVTNSGGLLPGFNLIGNPFTHNITFGNISLSAGSALTGGYVLNKAGSWSAILADEDASIKPCQGVLVQVSESATATISHTARARKASDDFISFAVANSQYEDVAFALFGEGSGLGKIDHQNPDIPMIYIHQDDEDYAIATMGNDTESFTLDFVAPTTGRYTLSVKPKGEFSYIHVIDKVTGDEIDMLKEKEYSFTASISDNADRFIVCLQHSDDAENSIFVYQSGTDIVVDGEGMLEVFDVMGRLVMQRHVNGVETFGSTSLQAGVYVFRLNEKTQKIVVR